MLGWLEAGLVEYADAEIVVAEDGSAAYAPIGGSGVSVRVSVRVDYAAARRAIVYALFPDRDRAWSSALAGAWGEHNAARKA